MFVLFCVVFLHREVTTNILRWFVRCSFDLIQVFLLLLLLFLFLVFIHSMEWSATNVNNVERSITRYVNQRAGFSGKQFVVVLIHVVAAAFSFILPSTSIVCNCDHKSQFHRFKTWAHGAYVCPCVCVCLLCFRS